MRPVYRTVFLLGVVVFAYSLQSYGQDKQFPIESTVKTKVGMIPFQWPSDTSATSRISKGNVITLLKEINKAQGEMDRDPDAEIGVENFTFSKLDDGAPYLLAVVDSSPMKWFQEIAIVRCTGVECSLTTLHSEPPVDINRQVLDLDQSGNHQVLVNECVCPEGGREAAEMVYLYGISNSEVRDVSADHPEFYRSKILPDLDRKMQQLTPDELNSQETIDERHAQLLFAKDDAERRVFGDRAAGLSDAQQWEQSSSKKIRTLAVMAYEDIDSPEAEAALKRMSASDSKWEREQAISALARKEARAAEKNR